MKPDYDKIDRIGAVMIGIACALCIALGMSLQERVRACHTDAECHNYATSHKLPEEYHP